jgi:glycosyltransferase 2 family protein
VKLSRVLQWVLGACLAAAGLLVFFRSVDMHGLAYQLSHAKPVGIVAGILLSLGSVWLRAARWAVMLPSPPRSHKKQLFPITCIAFMINNILPARMGEAARVVLLWRRNGYGAAVSIGSLLLERGIDVLVLGVCLFVPVFLVPEIGGGTKTSMINTVTLHSFAVVLAAAVACGIVLIAAYSLFPARVRGMLKAVVNIAPKAARPRIRRIGADVASTLDWTFSPVKTALVVALSAGIVLCYALIVFFLVGDKEFGIFECFFSQAFAALGAAIPLAPGYVGTLHAVMLEGLVLCGLERDKAQAVTILYHAIPYCAVTLLGLYYFFRLNVTFRDISEAEKNIEREDRGTDE